MSPAGSVLPLGLTLLREVSWKGCSPPAARPIYSLYPSVSAAFRLLTRRMVACRPLTIATPPPERTSRARGQARAQEKRRVPSHTLPPADRRGPHVRSGP